MVVLAHAPERVWHALTDRDALARWLLPASDDILPVSGHRFSFSRDAGKPIECSVLHAEPNRKLIYEWQPPSVGQTQAAPPARVEWTLEPIEGGTRLHLLHVHDGDSPFETGMTRLCASLASGSPAVSRFRRRRGCYPHRRYPALNNLRLAPIRDIRRFQTSFREGGLTCR